MGRAFSTINTMIKPITSELACPCPDLRVLHVDTDCIVINKPSGLHTVPGIGADKHDSVLTRLQAWDPAIYASHRLDRDTSGLLVFGRHKAAISHLGKQIQARTMDKHYIALVAGLLLEDEGEILLPMRYAEEFKPRQIIDSIAGKSAHTQWRVIARYDDTTRLALTPITGRTHQLRLHLQAIGHPILGDSLYAPAYWQSRQQRLCLHAAELVFVHPSSGQTLRFQAPADF